MSYAILIYQIPLEQEEFNIASKANSIYSVLFEFDNVLRNKLKYEKLSKEVYNALYGIQDEFRKLISDYDCENLFV